MTPKQTKFATEYLETGNATEAAIRAYKPKNRATAHSIGSENLTKPDIQRTIQETLRENGLDVALVIDSLVEDIRNKPMERASELLLASKLLGLLDKARNEAEHPIPILSILSEEEKKKIDTLLRGAG